MTKVQVRQLCRDGVYKRYTKECLGEILEIVRTLEVRYRSRTWENILKELSRILSGAGPNRSADVFGAISERDRDVIGIRSE